MTSERTAEEQAQPAIELVQRVEFLRKICRGRSVLHLGCTNWPYMEISSADDRFLHPVLLREASEVWGVDADAEGLKQLEKQGVPHLYQGDLELLGQLPIERTFDVIVAGEVIEHLSNPGLFLEGIRRFMLPDSDLVITTVNAYCGFRSAVYGLRGRGGRAEPIHPDHVAYYSFSTLNLMARRAKYRLEQFAFYDIGREHRPFSRRSIRLINDALVYFMPQLADGVIGVYRLDDQGKIDSAPVRAPG